jgi:hypothetical protein
LRSLDRDSRSTKDHARIWLFRSVSPPVRTAWLSAFCHCLHGDSNMTPRLNFRHDLWVGERVTAIAALRVVLIGVLMAASADPMPANAIAGRVVTGTVVSVQSSSVTIRLPNMLGYLRVRVRTYKVCQPASLLGLRPGDRISGVFSRSDGMLHRVRRLATVRDLQRQL